MGQVRQRRSRQNRKNPILSTSGMESSNNASIMQKLISSDSPERAWAATAISQLVLEDGPRQILIDSGAVQKLSSLLSDPVPIVIIEALGALRNLAISDESVCHALLESSILNGLQQLSVNLMNRIESLRSNPQMEVIQDELDIDQSFQMAEQIFGLLWPMIEISGDALSVGIELMSLLLFFFRKETNAPRTTREVMGQVILLCVDELTPSSQICVEMKAIVDDVSEPLNLRVIAASVLAHLDEYFYDIFPTLTSVLNQDWLAWINQINQVGSTPIPIVESTVEADIMSEARKLMDKQSLVLESMESELRICQLSCESLANMFTREDEEFDANTNPVDDNDLIRRLETIINSTSLITSLLGISEIPSPQSIDDRLLGVSFEWKLFQCRCLGALTNMFLLMDNEFIVSHSIPVSDLWNRIYLLQMNNTSLEINTSVIECLSALTRASPLNSIILNQDHLGTIINHYNQNMNIQIHIVGMFGVLGQYLGNVNHNNIIGDFLMQKVFETNSTIVIMEILNSIYDIYADKNFDYDESVFIQGGYLSLLKKLEPMIALKLSSEIGGDECLENLRAFIDYKELESQ